MVLAPTERARERRAHLAGAAGRTEHLHRRRNALAVAGLARQRDGAGVQLLLSLDRTLRQRGLALHLGAPSQPLRDACETLGATALLSNGATS
jgi:ABC-type transporter Mla MlaB component